MGTKTLRLTDGQEILLENLCKWSDQKTASGAICWLLENIGEWEKQRNETEEALRNLQRDHANLKATIRSFNRTQREYRETVTIFEIFGE